MAGAGCKQFVRSSRDLYAQALCPRYRFIIDGIITIPIALYGFVVFPNTPMTTSAFYLTEQVGVVAYEVSCFALTCIQLRNANSL